MNEDSKTELRRMTSRIDWHDAISGFVVQAVLLALAVWLLGVRQTLGMWCVLAAYRLNNKGKP